MNQQTVEALREYLQEQREWRMANGFGRVEPDDYVFATSRTRAPAPVPQRKACRAAAAKPRPPRRRRRHPSLAIRPGRPDHRPLRPPRTAHPMNITSASYTVDKLGFSCVTTIPLAFLANGLFIEYVPIAHAKRPGRSYFHPLRDAYRYVLQVVRMVMFFEPLRLSTPVALTLLVIGSGKFVFDMVMHPFEVDLADPDGSHPLQCGPHCRPHRAGERARLIRPSANSPRTAARGVPAQQGKLPRQS